MLEKTPEAYLKAPYARILIPDEEGGFTAEILEFPGCISEGETPGEALEHLEEAAKNWIEATLAQGQDIPPPSSSEGFSGKLVLRLPRSLHRQTVRMATRDGISLNQFLVAAISARVGAEDLFNRLAQRFGQIQVNINQTANIAVVIPQADKFYLPTSLEQIAETVSVPGARNLVRSR